MGYTSRMASKKVHGGRNAFEVLLATLGVIQKNGRGGHPQTHGKVERFQQTVKKWLRNQPLQPATIPELQHLLELFVAEYNNDRPHRSLDRRTPRAAYTARPKDHPPTEPPNRTHTRVRHDKVNNGKITLRHASQLFHIALGRHLNATPGHRPHPRPRHHHQQRHHRRNPARTHPRHHPPIPTPEQDNPRTHRGPGVADVLRHHIRRADRI